MTIKTKTVDELDVEWVQLIMEALAMGIDKDDIRTFLKVKESSNPIN